MHSSDSPQHSLTPQQEELLALLLEEEVAKADSEKPSSQAVPSSTLVPLQPDGDNLPLFLVGAFHFRLLAQHLGRHRPIYGLVGRNLDESKEYMGRVEEMAVGYVSDMQSVQPQGPYYLCGFCFGGLVAYEIAQQLRAQGEQIAFLGMLDTYSPTLRRLADQPPQPTRKERLTEYQRRIRDRGVMEAAAILRDWVAYRSTATSQSVHRFIASMYVRAGRPIPERFRGGFTRRWDSEAARHYDPKPYAGPVTMLASADVPEIRKGVRYLDIDPTLGWKDLIQGPITTALVEGEHGDFLKKPYVENFADQFERLLHAAERQALAESPT